MSAINNSKVYLGLNLHSHGLLVPDGSALPSEPFVKASLGAVCAQVSHMDKCLSLGAV